jgi:hypothetical protein
MTQSRSVVPFALAFASALALGLVAGCDGGGGGSGMRDSGVRRDAGGDRDAGGSDAGGSDAGGSDAGGSDAGGSDAGSGTDAGPLTSCVDLSQPNIMCDPLAGECDAPGSSCDVVNDGAGFPGGTECFPPPNDTPVGSPCDSETFCAVGSHCHVDTCRSFCCAEVQCPAGFYCDRLQFKTAPGAGNLGICLPGT